MQDIFRDPAWEEDVMSQFQQLDLDGNGALSPEELFPVVVEISSVHPCAISAEHCARFTQIFDKDGSGKIEKNEFVGFVKFLMAMMYLEGEKEKHMRDPVARAQQLERENATL